MDNKAKIEKNKIGYTITFPTRIYEDGEWIEFKSPLVLECHYIGDKDHGHKVAAFTFDFGMEHITSLTKEHNFILRQYENKSDIEKIVIDVVFDLFHAFFHTQYDPNYTDYHWALYGNLKDRVKIGELEA